MFIFKDLTKLYDHTISTQNREEQERLMKYLDENNVEYHVGNSCYLTIIREGGVYLKEIKRHGYFGLHWQDEFNVITDIEPMSVLRKRREQLLEQTNRNESYIKGLEKELELEISIQN